ncbi:MAG: cytochrome c oxidase assembly protein [Sneathiella sp.]|jgi:cytochrome c oxidase assembly protein subunit 11|uniref:cytochrome c oxidase assembly protein n=1 Tax=Sneathiella sp. TaxID=1964365 RepID=UPI000C40DF32|nr:cytochrome c oxidase assembly protein [Sneathiella sp.]MAL78631.1 cytochrome c oxidase assembly protein [Sneathiella sp.]|tara:strand:+ start:1590 stop:2177 length:588 start_codon:yes stop_codon:yes gene_type:complete
MKKTQGKSKRLALILASVAAGMVGLAYASVPLYDLFCRVTGYGGTTQQASLAPDTVLDREVVVEFDANTARDMPWAFKPVQHKMTLKVGESALAFYEAYNPSDKTVTGTAAFNVTPQKVGQYFTKIECFCFTEQVLKPGERVEMPVTFFVDPAIDQDPNAKDVKVITLSYTFFVSDEEEETDVSATVDKKSVDVN